MVSRNDLYEEYIASKRDTEKSNAFFYYLIYRPLSLFITPFFISLKVRPNSITFLTFLIVLMIPLSVNISNKSYIFVACLGIIYCVLDCVDGTIARNQNISSSFGMYMDSLFGKLYQLTLIFIILLLEYEKSGILNIYHVTICCLSALMFLWGSDSRAYFKLHIQKNSKGLASGKSLFSSVIISSIDLLPFLLFLSPFIGFFIISIFVFIYYLITFSATQISILISSFKQDTNN